MAQQRRHPVSNLALSLLVDRTGWSMSDLAKFINRVGAENGVRLQYNASAICHWLNGTLPRPEAVPVVVQAFARALGQPELAPEDLGWPDWVCAGPDRPWEGDPVALLTTLAREDMLSSHRPAVADLYVAGALSPFAPASSASSVVHANRMLCADVCDVARIRATTDALFDVAATHGGGHGRCAVSAYLVNDVVPHLRATTGPTRPKLLRAASELAYLLGWMSADAGAHGRAQRYFIQALRLADEAGDCVARCILLCRLFSQALCLVHRKAAPAMVDAAAYAVRAGCHPRVRAGLLNVQAMACALVEDRSGALAALRASERAMEHADSLCALGWFQHYRDEFFGYATGAVLVDLNDLKGAATRLADYLKSDCSNRADRTLIGIKLAHTQVAQGRPDEAAATLRSLSGDLSMMVSEQVRTKSTTLPRRTLTARSSAMAETPPHTHFMLP